MNLKRLQTFIQVVDRGRFSEVADILNLTQSGVSRQIKALEEEVGIRLLDRNTAWVELTPAGRLVYNKAKLLVAEWDQLIYECQGLKNELSGKLKIGASTIPATYLLPRIIKSFRDTYPRVEFSMMIEDSSMILEKLENQQIDIAIVGRNPQSSHFQTHSIAEDRLVLIGADSEQRLTSPEEIKTMPFIVREKGSGTREAMDKSLREHGIEPDELHYAAEVSSTESVLAMVEAEVGVSVVSHWAVRETVRENITVLYELPTDRRFYLVSHASHSSHPLTQAFMRESLGMYSLRE